MPDDILPSHVRGSVAEPLLDLTIGQALDRAAVLWPEAEAVVMCHQNRRMSYAALREAVDRCARGFVAMGLAPGARIGIWCPNRIEWVVTQYAAARAGLVLVCVNPAYRAPELEHALNLVGCEALVFAERFRSSDYVAILHELAPDIGHQPAGRLVLARLPHLRWLVLVGDGDESTTRDGMIRFDDVLQLGEVVDADVLGHRQAAQRPDDAVNIQFTSGTTGQPKGATLTHRNLVNNALFSAKRQELRAGDSICLPVPLYHCFAMVLGSLAGVVVGATCVYPAAAFEAASTLEAVSRERCTALYGVPTMFLAMLEDPRLDAFDLGSLRTGIMGGAPCPEAVMRSAIDRMGMKGVTIAFGMTETSPTSFQTDVGDTLARRVETVGRVHPHIEAKIVDAGGDVVGRGIAGEILVRGYSVMRGYWDEPDRTREAIDADGWMRTGDVGTIDADGYCRIVGRAKDMIIRGGENVFPREVEECLHRHPAIAEAQVFGIPDARLGERVCAWVRLAEGGTLTIEALRAHCRDHLSHFKIPDRLRIVDAFPMTVTGKPQKFAMRAAMEAALAE